jgi:cytochrome d ubiquinol oxidase subunit I
VARNQPCKLAALEAHYETGTGPTPMYLMGIPNNKEKRVDFGIAVPYLLTFLVHNDLKTPVTGLDKFPKEDQPPVLIPFLSYHAMAGLGCWFILLSTGSLVLLRFGKLFDNKLVMWAFVFTVLGAYAANETGWVAAEVGRQPWIVYGLLRTRDAVSHAVPATHVLSSIIMFSIVYVFLFAVWVHVMNAKIQHGPEGIYDHEEDMDLSVPPRGLETSFWKEAGELKGEYSLTQTAKSVAPDSPAPMPEPKEKDS